MIKKIHKDYWRLALLVVMVVLLLTLTVMQIIAAGSTVPGSNEDPVVTKSYVDAKISEALEGLSYEGGNTNTTEVTTVDDKRIEELTKKVLLLESELDSFSDLQNMEVATLNGKVNAIKFNVVQVFKDQKVYLGEGTELILRYGNATAFPGAGGDLTDITMGINRGEDSSIETNHLLISSRDDGRGVLITSEQAWILVKGKYTIE